MGAFHLVTQVGTNYLPWNSNNKEKTIFISTYVIKPIFNYIHLCIHIEILHFLILILI